MRDLATLPSRAMAAVHRAPGLFCLGLFLLLWMGPILLIIITSIKTNEDFLAGPFSLPSPPTVQPYITVWNALEFDGLLANSLLYATVGSALAVALALVPAYALSRKEIPGAR